MKFGKKGRPLTGGNGAAHYKMYKDGKQWIFTGITAFGLFLAGQGAISAQAAVNTQAETDAVASGESVEAYNGLARQDSVTLATSTPSVQKDTSNMDQSPSGATVAGDKTTITQLDEDSNHQSTVGQSLGQKPTVNASSTADQNHESSANESSSSAVNKMAPTAAVSQNSKIALVTATTMAKDSVLLVRDSDAVNMVQPKVGNNGTELSQGSAPGNSTTPGSVIETITNQMNTLAVSDKSSVMTSETLIDPSASDIQSTKVRLEKIANDTSRPVAYTAVDSVMHGATGMKTGSWDYDDSTATLTVHAGEFQNGTTISSFAPDVQTIILENAVVAAKNSSYLFSDLTKLVSVQGQLDMHQVSNMLWMFRNTMALRELDVSQWDTSQVTNMYQTFINSGLPSMDVSHWDTSKVTDMRGLFLNTKFTTINVINWDVGKVKYTGEMFAGAAIETLNISTWQIKSDWDQGMFLNANSLWKLTIGPGFLTSPGGIQLPSPQLSGSFIDGKTGLKYTVDGSGLWQAVAAGTDHNPSGEKLSGQQISTIYAYGAPDKVITYVWAQTNSQLQVVM